MYHIKNRSHETFTQTKSPNRIKKAQSIFQFQGKQTGKMVRSKTLYLRLMGIRNVELPKKIAFFLIS